MGHFPLFISLKEKKCIVVGGGLIAERKIEALLGFDADVTVVSPKVTNNIQDYQKAGQIRIILREYEACDIEGAFIVIAATSDHTVNKIIYNDAAYRNIFINVVDCPEMCTFLFPSTLKRGELTVGITTSGAYPALSKRLRKFFETLIPENYSEVLSLLKEYRKKAIQEIMDQNNRKNFLNHLLDIVESKGINNLQDMEMKFKDILKEYKNEKSC